MNSSTDSNNRSLVQSPNRELAIYSSALIKRGLDLINTLSKEEVFLNIGHAGLVKTAVFSPDGRYVISGSDDHTLKLWDVSIGRVVRTFTDYTGRWCRVAFSPDGRFILTGSSENKIELRDIHRGKVIKIFTGHEEFISSVLFSHAGNLILSGSHDKTMRLWDVSKGNVIRSFIGHSSIIECIAFSPDDQFVISGDIDGTIKLWDIKKEGSIKEWIDESGPIASLAFSLDGRFIFEGGGGGIIETGKMQCRHNERHLIMWDIMHEKRGKKMSTQPDTIQSIRCLPDGQHIVTGGGGGQVTLCDISLGIEIKKFNLEGRKYAVAFSPNGKYILTNTYDQGLELHDISSGKKIRTFSHPIDPGVIAISNNSQHCLSGGNNGLKLWDIQSGKKMRDLCRDSDFSVHSVKFLSDQLFAVSANRHGFRLWDVLSWKCVNVHEDLSTYHDQDGISRFKSSALSPDGKSFAGAIKGVISIWDVLTAKKTETVELPDYKLFFPDIAMSNDGNYVIIEDKFSHKFDILNINALELKTHRIAGEIIEVSFSPDNRFVLLGDGTGNVYIWDIVNEKEFIILTGHQGSISSITFVNEVQFLSGSTDGSIKLWDIHTGELIRTFRGHLNEINSLSTNGSIILSGGRDGIKAWVLSTGELLASLTEVNDGEWIVITPEGYYNASKNGEQYINVRVGDKAYGIDNYRQKYYRPDLIRKILSKPY